MTTYHVKRIYDDSAKDDGARILVDRIWPRGVSKEKAQLTEWVKEIAPSPDLRKWFDHKPERFKEFGKKYKAELKSNGDAVKKLQEISDTHKSKSVTLLYAAKDEKHNHARVLKQYLEQNLIEDKEK